MLKILISKYILILRSQYFSLLLLGWIYYFINLKLWAWAVTEWESGYFIYFDSWIPWMDSCTECDNSTEWTAWSDNMYLDSSNQCIFFVAMENIMTRQQNYVDLAATAE